MKTAATLTILDAAKMTKRGRSSVAAWLRQQARYLTRKKPPNYASRHIARYFYR